MLLMFEDESARIMGNNVIIGAGLYGLYAALYLARKMKMGGEKIELSF